MGNAALTCVSKGGGGGGGTGDLRKIRVLLPDGNIALLDKPVEAANFMLEYLNHMVVHCSTAGSQSMGQRATMSIMQPHEKLQPGQAYVVHPIPAQYTKNTRVRPQPLSLPKRTISKVTPVQGDGAESQEQADSRQKSARRQSLHRFQSRVADAEADAAQTPELHSDARQSDEAKKQQQGSEGSANGEGDDDEGDIVLNLNMYMGWRPALESIPESPMAFKDQRDKMKTLPVACA